MISDFISHLDLLPVTLQKLVIGTVACVVAFRLSLSTLNKAVEELTSSKTYRIWKRLGRCWQRFIQFVDREMAPAPGGSLRRCDTFSKVTVSLSHYAMAVAVYLSAVNLGAIVMLRADKLPFSLVIFSLVYVGAMMIAARLFKVAGDKIRCLPTS